VNGVNNRVCCFFGRISFFAVENSLPFPGNLPMRIVSRSSGRELAKTTFLYPEELVKKKACQFVHSAEQRHVVVTSV